MIQNRDFHLDLSYRPGHLLISVFNFRLANRLNRVLKYYSSNLRRGEEAVFHLSARDFEKIRFGLCRGRGAEFAQFLDQKLNLSFNLLTSDGSTLPTRRLKP